MDNINTTCSVAAVDVLPDMQDHISSPLSELKLMLVMTSFVMRACC